MRRRSRLCSMAGKKCLSRIEARTSLRRGLGVSVKVGMPMTPFRLVGVEEKARLDGE